MNKIIGGGPTGRLFIHLREEKGYTYGASSGLVAPLYRGEWQASTNVRTEVTGPALPDLLDEITADPRGAGHRRGAGGREAIADRRSMRWSSSRRRSCWRCRSTGGVTSFRPTTTTSTASASTP